MDERQAPLAAANQGGEHGQGHRGDHDIGGRLRHRAGRRAGVRPRQGGERLHNWVFGGPWSYDSEPSGEMSGEDKVWMDQAMSGLGAVVGGRWTYEAADHWGGQNPWGIPFFIVTHRPEEQPPGEAFTFVGSVEEGIERASRGPVRRRATRTCT